MSRRKIKRKSAKSIVNFQFKGVELSFKSARKEMMSIAQNIDELTDHFHLENSRPKTSNDELSAADLRNDSNFINLIKEKLHAGCSID